MYLYMRFKIFIKMLCSKFKKLQHLKHDSLSAILTQLKHNKNTLSQFFFIDS